MGSKFLRATGEHLVARAMIFKMLLEGEQSVNQLTEATGLHVQTVRNFLMALQGLNLLAVRLGEQGRIQYRVKATLWEPPKQEET